MFSVQALPLMTKLISGKFSKDFAWGIASSNYQMEGAVYQDGKCDNKHDGELRLVNSPRSPVRVEYIIIHQREFENTRHVFMIAELP